ncbi:MAG TPA: MFS transporter, partial [Rhodanobacteraceae bacterium]|nr:MFS transporter [Rhodanobacteraceae bacterium]
LGMDVRHAWAMVERVISRESMTLAVNDVFLGCAILFVFLIPLVWLAKPPFGSTSGASGH